MVNILYYPENYDPGHYIRIEPPTIVPEPAKDEDAEWLRKAYAALVNERVMVPSWFINEIDRIGRIADRLEAKEIVPETEPEPEIDEDAEWLRAVFASAAKWSIEDISRANRIADRLEAKEIVPETEPEPEIDEDAECWSDLNDAVVELAESVQKLAGRINERLDKEEEK